VDDISTIKLIPSVDVFTEVALLAEEEAVEIL
jgi:hypothetical protein